MANKRTSVLTVDQYANIIRTIREGAPGMYKHPDVATALVVQANMGMRVGDIIQLRMCDIVRDGGNWRLNVIEQKTKKVRLFTVPDGVYEFIKAYADEKGIKDNEILFPFTERKLQRTIQNACAILGYENISTHSFRKFAASRVYEASGYDIELTRAFLQHSSVSITQRYLATCNARMNSVINKTVALI